MRVCVHACMHVQACVCVFGSRPVVSSGAEAVSAFSTISAVIIKSGESFLCDCRPDAGALLLLTLRSSVNGACSLERMQPIEIFSCEADY